MRLDPPGTLAFLTRLGRRGHNLLEVIIASFVFATVMILMMGIWTTYYRAQGQARNHLAASSLGRAVLEQMVAAGYDACDPARPFGNDVLCETEVRGRPASTRMHYQFQADNATEPNFRKLQVTVTWKDSTGDHSLIYETFIYRTN